MSSMGTPKPAIRDTKPQHIQVFVRVRPFSEQEVAQKSHTAVTVKGWKEVVVNDHTTPKISKTFTFDGVFDNQAKQSCIYQRVGAQSVADVLSGFNCTVFAYGQTGSGKTYTMEGDLSEGDQGAKAGLIPRAMSSLFDELRLQKAEFVVKISFVELYNEELYDLFSPDDVPPKLRLFDDPAKKGSVVIQPLEEIVVHSKNQVLETLKKGLAKRQVAATQINAQSSRSHTVFCATVHTKENNVDGEEVVKFGKLYLVDLAGSENVGRSGSVDKRAREAGSINQSLLTLGRVINSLVERQPHIPYRESKLTRVLQDSLGGKTKTSIIATVSPAASNVEETLSTLDYAMKAKSVSNKPEVNQRVSKEAVMKEYAVLIEDLKKKLNLTREGSGIYLANENYKAFIEQLEERNRDLVEKIAEIRVCVNETKRYERLFAELSNQLGSKEEKLIDVKRHLEETTKYVKISKVVLEEEQEKLAETTELVEKADQYENHVHAQAENLISIVEEIQSDSTQLHSKLDNSRSIEKHNIQYACSLIKELDRLKESLSMNLDRSIGAAACLKAINRLLYTVKDDCDEEIQELKNRVNSEKVQVLSALKKISAALEDQENYKKTWDEETLAETNERCEESVKAFISMEEEVTASFESYKNLIKAIGEMKGPIAETVYDVQKEWLDIIEKAMATSGKGLKDAVKVLNSQVHQGEVLFKNIESSTNKFSEQEAKFEKEQSDAFEKTLQIITSLERLLDSHEAGRKEALANMEKHIEDAGDFIVTCEPIVTDRVNSIKEETLSVVDTLNIEAPFLHQRISNDTAELVSRINSSENIIIQTEVTCEENCTNNSSAWDALVSNTENALMARERQSNDTRHEENECFEAMRKELAELDRRYAEDVRKIEEKYDKFKGESDSSLDRASVVTQDLRSDFKDLLKTQSDVVRTFVQDQFKRDCPTGQTPPRKDMRIPPTNDPLASPDVRRILRKVDEDSRLVG